MNELLGRFGGQLTVLAILALVSAAMALAVRGQRHWPFGLAPAPACLAAGSAFAIAAATLSPQAGARSPGRVQLEPFHTIRSYLMDASDLAIYLCGNVALFVPLGFFLYLALRRGALLPVALAACASAGVEILQLPIWSRSSDVDDVLLNSFGGLLGVLAAVLWRVCAERAAKRSQRRREDQQEHEAGTLTTTLLPAR